LIKVQFQKQKQTGGPGIFQQRISVYMAERELIKIVDINPDIYFASVFLEKPPRLSKSIYRSGAVYYNSKERKRKGFNKKIANSIRSADYVVFQSKFSERSSRKILDVHASKFSIIHNGFDVSAFLNLEHYQSKKKHLFCACANWKLEAKRGDFIVDSFVKANIKDSELLMIGANFNSKWSGFSNENLLIACTGRLDIFEISKYLACKPTFIHLCYAEACPNAVIEALSFGCPVIGNNIGATPELIGDSGIIANCDKKFRFRMKSTDTCPINPDSVVAAIRESVGRQWTVNRPDLSMENCANKYLTIFKNLL